MKLTLGFSPCPNDTFIFDALVNRKIDSGGLDFEVLLEDVETLNQWALQDKLDISKISYGNWPLLRKNYDLLDAGGALGIGVGPLLISKSQIPANQVSHCRVAIPGRHTTAHLLFSMAYPEALDKEFLIFSAIEDAVLAGKADCGVIIHENRFTYEQKGLVKLMDLGEFWEKNTGFPIPLGGIVMKKNPDPELAKKINELICKSIQHAFLHYPILPEYVREHSQEMNEQVMRQHIDLYVNRYSLTLGQEGRKAIETLLQVYQKMNQEENRQAVSFI